MTTWNFHNGKQISFVHKLETLSKVNKKILELMFEMVDNSKRVSTLEHDLSRVKKELSIWKDINRDAQIIPISKLSDHEKTLSLNTVSINDNTVKVSTSKKLAISKRKAGYSLINPNLKRHNVAKGAKISLD